MPVDGLAAPARARGVAALHYELPDDPVVRCGSKTNIFTAVPVLLTGWGWWFGSGLG